MLDVQNILSESTRTLLETRLTLFAPMFALTTWIFLKLKFSSTAFCGVGYGYAETAGVGACTECPVRQYKSIAGNTACSPCPDGFTTSGVGQTACTQCECLRDAAFSNFAREQTQSNPGIHMAYWLALPISDHGVLGSTPTRGEIFSKPKLCFCVQSSSCSPVHLDMTEILLNRI